jgi:hypothetical protein
MERCLASRFGYGATPGGRNWQNLKNDALKDELWLPEAPFGDENPFLKAQTGFFEAPVGKDRHLGGRKVAQMGGRKGGWKA